MNSDSPTVSVILPTYDRAPLLRRSIDSVLSQTYEDFELIVVDDGSRDGTEAVIAAVTDERLRYVAHGANRGLSTARNTGIGQARGRYVAFQDSDDEWLGDKLARQVPKLQARDSPVVVYSDMHRVRADGRVLYHRAPDMERGRLVNPETRYWQPYMLGIQSAILPRECLEVVGGFDEDFAAFEDLDLFLRLSAHYDFVHVREALVNYYATDGLSADRRAELSSRRRLVRKHLCGLLRSSPGFAVKESVDVLLKRSLLPIVDRHVTPIAP